MTQYAHEARDWLDRDELRKKREAEEIRSAAAGHTCQRLLNAASLNFEVCGRPATNIVFGQMWWPGHNRPSWRCRRCWYREYLESGHWKRLRERMLRRSHWKCQVCGEQAGRSAKGNRTGLNVHHLSYERVGYEHDEDLIVLCFDCHGKEHGRSV